MADSLIPGLPGMPGMGSGVPSPDVSGISEVFNSITAMNNIDVMGYIIIVVCVIVMLGSFSMIMINMAKYRG